MGSFTSDPSETSITIDLDVTVQNGRVTITLSEPNGKWFSVGIGSLGFATSNQPYTIVVDETGNVSERKLGDHNPGTLLESSLTVISNTVVD